jgi:hypothetical protein
MHAPNITPRTAGYIFAGILSACAGAEIGRVVADVPWGAFTPAASHAVSIVLAAIWIVAALAIALRDRWESLETVAWATAFPAAFLLFMHGFVAAWGAGGTSAASRAALLYPMLAIGGAFLLRRAFDGALQTGESAVPSPQPVPWASHTAWRERADTRVDRTPAFARSQHAR